MTFAGCRGDGGRQGITIRGGTRGTRGPCGGLALVPGRGFETSDVGPTLRRLGFKAGDVGGVTFLGHGELDQTMALVQDYVRYADIYGPDVRESRLLNQDGSRFRVYFQFYTKKIWTVVLNTEHDVEYQFLGDTRAHVPSRSTRIVEVEHPDTPDAREQPEGNDRGTMWHFNNYCSFEARDGDMYMQCESITLSRGIPFLLSVFLRPFVNGVPREKLTSTLEATRRFLTQ